MSLGDILRGLYRPQVEEDPEDEDYPEDEETEGYPETEEGDDGGAPESEPDPEDEESGEGKKKKDKEEEQDEGGGLKKILKKLFGFQGTANGVAKEGVNVGEMNKKAKDLKCTGPRTKYQCPFCKKRSIYPEPLVTKSIRNTCYYLASIGQREKRFICLNPKCKAYYEEDTDAARFAISLGGGLKTTHGLHTPRNLFSFRRTKK